MENMFGLFSKNCFLKKINKDNQFKKKVMDNVKKKPNILWEIKNVPLLSRLRK